jgi:hypothetical protein
MSKAWYCKAFGQELGPMSFADLAVLVERKDVLPADLIKCGADGPWQPARATPGLFAAESKAPSSLFQTNSDSPCAGLTNADSTGADLKTAEFGVHDDSERIASDDDPNRKAPQPADESLEVPAQNPKIPESSARRRNIPRIAAAVALVLLGASAGALTGWLMPVSASSPAVASPSTAINQQRIEALRRQIAELQNERERLDQAVQAIAPKSSENPAPAEPQDAAAGSPSQPPDRASEETVE